MFVRALALAAVAASTFFVTAAPSEARVVRLSNGRTIWVNPVSRVGLNPQPLPPRWIIGNRGIASLNPQPLPPRWVLGNRGIASLNPQPLPPRWTFQRFR